MVALSLCVAGGGSLRAVARGEDAPVARHAYVVRAGDTLWDIAQAETGGRDPRPLVDAIVAVNQLDDPTVRPGQRLLVPASG